MKKLIISLFVSMGLLFAQAPVIKPQPSTAVYGVGEIYLFQTYNTRDAYESAFGVQAPPFNPAKPAKLWFDKTVQTPTVTYQTLDLVTLKNVTLTLSKEDAASVNIPGAYRYDPYLPKPAECVRWIPGLPMPSTPFESQMVSEKSEAEALAQEIGGTLRLATTEGGTLSGFAVKCGTGDTRNVWEVVTPAGSDYAGRLLAKKYALGVGSPGKWQGLDWVPVTPVTTTSNYMRTPVRQLLANEKFLKNPFGNQIERTDMDQANAGGMTLADRAKLDEILKIVKEIKAKVQ